MAPLGSYTSEVFSLRGQKTIIIARLSEEGCSFDWQHGENVAPKWRPLDRALGVGEEYTFDLLSTNRDDQGVSLVVRNTRSTLELVIVDGTSRNTLSTTYSKFLRSIIIEIDFEKTALCEAFVRDNLQQMQALVTKGFHNARVEVTFSGTNWVPASSVRRSLDDLNDVMAENFSARMVKGVSLFTPLTFHVFVADQAPEVPGLPGGGLLGIMYDHTDDTPREGAALFLQGFTPRVAADPGTVLDYVAHTVVHEVGHALNLRHSMEKRPAALSFMNYPHKFQEFVGSPDRGVYWKRFLSVWNFDREERLHLWHADPQAIYPRGSQFGVDAASTTSPRPSVRTIAQPNMCFVTMCDDPTSSFRPMAWRDLPADVRDWYSTSQAAQHAFPADEFPSSDDGKAFFVKYLRLLAVLEKSDRALFAMSLASKR